MASTMQWPLHHPYYLWGTDARSHFVAVHRTGKTNSQCLSIALCFPAQEGTSMRSVTPLTTPLPLPSLCVISDSVLPHQGAPAGQCPDKHPERNHHFVMSDLDTRRPFSSQGDPDCLCWAPVCWAPHVINRKIWPTSREIMSAGESLPGEAMAISCDCS